MERRAKKGKVGGKEGAKSKSVDATMAVNLETAGQGPASSESELVILRELRKLRQEHAEAVGENKT